jgi:hypothetical protein
VNDGKRLHPMVLPRIEDLECEANSFVRLRGLRRHGQIHVVFGQVRNPGDEFHATPRTFAGTVRADVPIQREQFSIPKDTIGVAGSLTLDRPVTVEGLYPQHVPKAVSMQVVAALPNGDVEPMVWLYEYQDVYRHPFLFRRPLALPVGSVIRGVRGDAKILLIPAARTER